MEKLILGLSGGVDSAVSAALLKERGFAVTGVWLDNGVGSAEDAGSAAEALGIPFMRADIRAEIEKNVCEPFARAYVSGRTPSPCLRCNPLVKFPALLRAAEKEGAEKIATGHYARSENGRLYMGRPANDQSYMLAYLTEDVLRRTVFPLAELEKTEVRKIAARLGLALAKKPDSMEICFIPDGDFAAYIERRGEVPPPGDFIDESGRVLGRHLGIHRYTVGQRRGLGVALGERMCVKRIDAASGRIVLAPAGQTAESLATRDVRWINGAPEGDITCSVRIRHSKALYPASVTPDGFVRFLSPAPLPAPGQSAVFYDGQRVLGAGEII